MVYEEPVVGLATYVLTVVHVWAFQETLSVVTSIAYDRSPQSSEFDPKPASVKVLVLV